MASADAGYSGTPLPRKLGIRPGHRVLLRGAPAGFELGPLPGVVALDRLDDPPAGRYDVVLGFCRDRAALLRTFGPLKATLEPTSALWLAWPKRASKVETDLTEADVREHGLAGGLVDVKVCAVDAVWSGLKFVYRTADRPTVSRTQA